MQCVNTNTREYQTLLKQSGLSDFELETYVGEFLDTLGRYPYLDELPKANSSKAISEDLSLNKDNTTKTENILQAANTNTIEEAVHVLNDKYRDKEIEVLEVGSKSKVYVTTRPSTIQNQDGETDKQIKIATEIADIKERALANGTFMLAPNGKPTHLTEQQWLQVRTQEFKDWFCDWINDPVNASKVVDENGEPKIVYHQTSADFTTFEVGRAGRGSTDFETPIGIFVKDTQENIFNSDGKQIPLFANSKKVISFKDRNELINWLKTNIPRYNDYLKELKNIYEDELFDLFPGDSYEIGQEVKELITKHLKDLGYDGFELINDTGAGPTIHTTVLFTSNQIKSATDNNGQFSSSNNNINDDYENVNSFAFFNEIIDKLQTLYGISIIPITNAELSQDRWVSITGTKGVKSFIYNGNIYINTDIATVDSPVHEFLHLLFGSMKYQNRALYDQLVGQAKQFSSYDSISQNYPNRTKGDINEEVFVTELAKYLTGRKNAISSLEQSIQDEIIYNVNRTLDTVLMGENSVRCVENPYAMNLKTLAKLVNSSTMISEKRGSLSDAALNRMMANTKSELMRNKELREECQ